MRPHPRKLIDLLSKLAVPILATIAAVFLVLVVLAFFRRDVVMMELRTYGSLQIENRMGGLRVTRIAWPFDRMRWSWETRSPTALVTRGRGEILGFSWLRAEAVVSGGTQTHSLIDFTFPHWFVIATCCGPIVFIIRRNRRLNKRIAGGLCLNCGYDLRASPGRCPECGAEKSLPQMNTDEHR